jgi:hypothetical protein
MSTMPTSAIFRHIQPLQVAPGVDRRLRTCSAPAYCFSHPESEQRQYGRPASRPGYTGEASQSGSASSTGWQPGPDGSTGVRQAPGCFVAKIQGTPAKISGTAGTGTFREHGSLLVYTSGPQRLASSQQELPPVLTRSGNRTVGAGSRTFTSAGRRDSVDRSQERFLPNTRLLSCERTDMACPSPGW